MKSRLANGLTTVLGLIILGAVFAFIWTGKLNWTEASGFLTIGTGILFSKDQEFINNFLKFKKGLNTEGSANNAAEFEEVKPTDKEETK